MLKEDITTPIMKINDRSPDPFPTSSSSFIGLKRPLLLTPRTTPITTEKTIVMLNVGVPASPWTLSAISAAKGHP